MRWIDSFFALFSVHTLLLPLFLSEHASFAHALLPPLSTLGNGGQNVVHSHAGPHARRSYHVQRHSTNLSDSLITIRERRIKDIVQELETAEKNIADWCVTCSGLLPIILSWNGQASDVGFQWQMARQRNRLHDGVPCASCQLARANSLEEDR
jgi:hypothetical protein